MKTWWTVFPGGERAETMAVSKSRARSNFIYRLVSRGVYVGDARRWVTLDDISEKPISN